MSSDSSASVCVGRRVSASSPACTRGCSVLTRPSRHSGNPVTSSTRVTGTPASAIRRAVDPVETISTPAACSPVARSSRPALSNTLTRARRIGRRPSVPDRAAAWDSVAVTEFSLLVR